MAWDRGDRGTGGAGGAAYLEAQAPIAECGAWGREGMAGKARFVPKRKEKRKGS